MSRRDNAERRCPRCHMLDLGCICAELPEPKLALQTRVVLITHYREDRRPTNTGRLATECLANAEVLVRGHRDQPLAPLSFAPDSQPLLLYPAAHATLLVPCDRPVTLIVPDGSWRQASKVRLREPGLADIPCVVLPEGAPTTYRLRHEPKPGGLATMEAIARALGILEGPAAQQTLERVFDAMVASTLRSRGQPVNSSS